MVSDNLIYAIKEDDSPLTYYSGDNARGFLKGILSEYDTLDNDIQDAFDATHIDTATKGSLDRLGKLSQTQRKTSEGDDKYRARIKANFRASSTGTRFSDTIEFAATMFDAEMSEITLNPYYSSEAYATTISIPRDAVNAANLSNAEVAGLMNDVMPVSATATVVKGGSFHLKADGDTDEPSEGLTADGSSEGGTLAADLV